jgi:hypothetical protein
MTPEEKLSRHLRREGVGRRDTSLAMPPGTFGTVVEVRVFNRHGVEKDERAMAIEREEIQRLAKDRDDEQSILDRNIYGRLAEMLRGQVATSGPKGFRKGVEIDDEALEAIRGRSGGSSPPADDALMTEIEALRAQYDESRKRLESRFIDKVEKLQRGDELPPGVMKMVKVFVAVKRKIQPATRWPAVTATRASCPRSCRSRTCRSWRTGPCRHRAQSARRAEPDECRADPGDASWLGLRGPGQEGRQTCGGIPQVERHQGAARHAARALWRQRQERARCGVR